MSKKLFECEINYIRENCPIYGIERTAGALGRGTAIVRNATKKYSISTPKRGEALNDNPPLFDKDYINFSKRFENITPELAYWIGFFWADGFINFTGCMRIEITEEDGECLKKLFLSIFPFLIYKRARRNKKCQMLFSVTDNNVSELLKSLGKFSNTNESHEKVFNYLKDENLIKYFLRGLIDGDGNFYINKSIKYAQFTLASNYEQDWSCLEKYFFKFNPHINREKTTHGNSSTLRITGKENLANFIKFLEYDRIKIGLERKSSKAIEILNMCEMRPTDTKMHIMQFEKDGTFLKEWNSALEVSKSLGCTKSAIQNCCMGYSKTSMGYKWKYKNEI